MQRKTKKILIIVNFVLVVSFLTVLFLFVYFSVTEPLTKKFMTGKPVKFMLIVYGTEKLFPDMLDAYFVSYEKHNGLLKVLSINTDAVVFKKNARARSLKYSFFNDMKKSRELALSNFQQDIFNMADNSFSPDFYITVSFEDLLRFAGKDPALKKLIENKDFANRDLECLAQLEFAEGVLDSFRKRTISSIKSARKNHFLLDTNISKLAFANMIMYFKMYETEVMFFDLPVKYTKIRVEPDRDNIADLLYTIYYPVTDMAAKSFDGFIDVKNASGKARMAEKAAWKLRENKFDVLEWGNFKTPYEKTLIKNYKGNCGAAKEIAAVLGCGKVINSYNNKSSLSASVFIGKDCEIYDKRDKKEDVNGKN